MKDQTFCCVGNWGVLIPYQDLEKMVDSLKNAQELQKQYEQTQKELTALRGLWMETLEKIAEINATL